MFQKNYIISHPSLHLCVCLCIIGSWSVSVLLFQNSQAPKHKMIREYGTNITKTGQKHK